MKKVLKDVPDDRVTAYVIWDPIFGGNFDRESNKLPKTLPDKRVRYFKDPDSVAGTAWRKVLNLFRPIAWDVYLLYGADSEWQEEPPQPDYWMHQLSGLKTAPILDEKKFTEELRGLLNKLNAQGSKKVKQ
jgi:hypothetical protein